ncbi:MAG: enoyl-CoA hydratase/isomerase family protein [Gaiellaceae bacterium]
MPVAFEKSGGIGVLTLSRPSVLNALDTATLNELRTRLIAFGEDEAVQVIVLTGAGERAFSVGADIREMQGKHPGDARVFARLGQDCARALETMAKPTIAAVNGAALGGGFEMALACDLRYAVAGASFGFPEINLGLIPGWGGIERLTRVVGVGLAKEIVLSGRSVSAAEALEKGLVHGLCEPAALLDIVRERAALLTTKSPVALARAKRALNDTLQGSHEQNLHHEGELFAGLFGTTDAREGMTAFLEKREPHFQGK